VKQWLIVVIMVLLTSIGFCYSEETVKADSISIDPYTNHTTYYFVSNSVTTTNIAEDIKYHIRIRNNLKPINIDTVIRLFSSATFCTESSKFYLVEHIMTEYETRYHFSDKYWGTYFTSQYEKIYSVNTTLITEICNHNWVLGKYYIRYCVTYEEPQYYPPQGLMQIEYCTKCGIIRIPKEVIQNETK